MSQPVKPVTQATGLVGGEVLSHEAIAAAIRAGYVPVMAVDNRTRQQRRDDERQAMRNGFANPATRRREKSDKLKKLLGKK